MAYRETPASGRGLRNVWCTSLNINITADGHAYLGSYIGSEAGKSAYTKDQIKEWIKDIDSLANIAKTEPQLAYAAYVYGMSKRWMFLSRTTPCIAEEMKILEHHIKEREETLIPAIVGKDFISDEMRKIFSLPARLGGMGFIDPSKTSDLEYESSIIATSQLTEAIFNQVSHPELDQETQSEAMKIVKKKKEVWYKGLQQNIISESNTTVAKIIELSSEKGASCWLTSLPLKRYGFLLNKQEFHDAVCLRYNFAIKLAAKVCACGERYSVNHCLTCKKGGYVILRHNSLRDLFAELLREFCHDVDTEPVLLPLTGEKLPPGSNTADGARLDVSARGLYSPLDKAFIDIRVFKSLAKSNWEKKPADMYKSNQNEKRREYGPRLTQVEKAGGFIPAILSTSGGIGKECDIPRIAERIALKRKEKYSDVVAFIRRRVRFDLLRTCVISLRGYRKPSNNTSIESLDFNLRKVASVY